MKITLELLKKLNACYDGIKTYQKLGEPETIEKCIELAGETNAKYCNWLMVRLMDKNSKIKY